MVPISTCVPSSLFINAGLKKIVEGLSVCETTAAACPSDEELWVKTAYPEADALGTSVEILKRKRMINAIDRLRQLVHVKFPFVRLFIPSLWRMAGRMKHRARFLEGIVHYFEDLSTVNITETGLSYAFTLENAGRITQTDFLTDRHAKEQRHCKIRRIYSVVAPHIEVC